MSTSMRDQFRSMSVTARQRCKVNNVYAAFGRAAEAAQAMETAAGTLALAYVAMWTAPANSAETSNQLRQILADIDRQTLGRLLRSLGDTLGWEKSLVTTLDVALERRNYLTHKFFRHHNFAISSNAGRLKMLAELQEIASTLAQANQILDGLTVSLDTLSRTIDGRALVAEVDIASLLIQGKRLDL